MCLRQFISTLGQRTHLFDSCSDVPQDSHLSVLTRFLEMKWTHTCTRVCLHAYMYALLHAYTHTHVDTNTLQQDNFYSPSILQTIIQNTHIRLWASGLKGQGDPHEQVITTSQFQMLLVLLLAMCEQGANELCSRFLHVVSSLVYSFRVDDRFCLRTLEP